MLLKEITWTKMEKYTREYLLPGISKDRKKVAARKPLELQILTFADKMEAYQDRAPSGMLGDGETEADARPRFVPQIIGVTENGATVTLNVFGFAPFFLIKCPDRIGKTKWKDDYLEDIKAAIIQELGNQKYHLRNIEIKKLRSFRGFKNFKKFRYIEVQIDNDKMLTKIINKVQKGIKLPAITPGLVSFEVGDTRIGSILKFIHMSDIDTGGWIKIHGYEEVESSLCKSTFELNIDSYNIKKIIRPDKAPMVRLSWDIEVNSKDGHSFPVPEIKENRVYQISNNFRVEGDVQSKLKILLTLKECDPISPKETIDDGASKSLAKGTKVIVVEYPSEKDLLFGWIDLINSMDPDYVYGFNNFGFDHEYIGERSFYLDGGSPRDTRGIKPRITDMAKSKENGLCNGLLHMGRIDKMDEWYTKLLQSSALGSRKMSYNFMSGRVIFDVMHAIATVQNLDSYKLDDCAKIFLNSQKKDVPPTEMFKMYQSGTPAEMKKIGVYCIVDSELPHGLVDKLNLIWSNVAIATVSSVPIDYIFTRGQSVKIGSYCSKKCRLEGIAFDDLKEEKKYDYQKFYEGAYCMNAKPAFFADMIYVCDFNSLYPSEEISHGMSHDTDVDIGGEYDGLEGVIYTDFHVPTKRLVPNILPDLGDRKTGKAAKAAKDAADALAAAETASVAESNLDEDDPDANGYGIDGDCAGTMKQRDQDKKIKKVSPQELAKIIQKYYDVHGTFNNLEDNAETSVKPPKDMNNPKQVAIFEKKLKKVNEEFPNFVTLRKELAGTTIEPLELSDEILDLKIPVSKCKIVITTKVCRFAQIPGNKGILPKILSEVLLARAETREKAKYNLARIERNKLRMEGKRTIILDDGKEISLEEHIRIAIKKLEESKKWTKGFVTEMLDNLTKELNREIDTVEYDKAVLAKEIALYKTENSNYESLANAFKVTANSFYGQTGSSYSMIANLNISASTTTAGQIDIKLAADVVERNFPNSTVVYGDTDSVFVCAKFPEIRKKYKNKILTKEELDPILRKIALERLSKGKEKGFVPSQDEINVMTNSFTETQIEKISKEYIAALLEEELILASMKQAIEAAKKINEAINRPPMNIEFEKVISRFIQYTPKRYKGYYHTNMKAPMERKIKTMGLCDKKRDTTKWTVKNFQKLTEALMNYEPHAKIIDMFKDMVRKLLDGDLDPKDLILTKKIGQTYKGPLPAHVVVANRIKARGDPIVYEVNDRIPCIITLTEDLTKNRPISAEPKLCDMLEGFYYAMENELPINYLRYASHVCLTPLMDTVALIHPDPVALVREVCEEFEMPKWFRINYKGTKHKL